MARTILVVDDERNIIELVRLYLEQAGFTVAEARDGRQALEQHARLDPDLVVLDLMLPEMDGMEVTREIRRRGETPILMLTARGEDIDRIIGLELGADDYLPKPFEPRELLARIQTVLRRTTAASPVAAPVGLLRFDGLQIDLPRRTVLRQDEAVELTGTEFELLALLAGAPGKVFTRDDILARLRGHAAEDIHSRAVDILVSRLRKKLEPLDAIRTLRNVGYVFAGVRH